VLNNSNELYSPGGGAEEGAGTCFTGARRIRFSICKVPNARFVFYGFCALVPSLKRSKKRFLPTWTESSVQEMSQTNGPPPGAAGRALVKECDDEAHQERDNLILVANRPIIPMNNQ
jgi:hypothetical protein